MQLEIITIGDELLIGQVIDTNSAWMGVELNKLGFEVNRITSVSDSREAIESSVNEAFGRVDVVLMTGGLGPTRDDITKQVLCELFDTKLVFNEEVFSDICKFLKGRVKTINDLNRSQAMVPEKCTVIRNPVGTAPVMWFERDSKILVSMPGVPAEMKHTMENEVLPRLKKKFLTGYIVHRTVHIYQIPEAVLAEMLSEWEDAIPAFIKVAYLPQPGIIRLRLTARGENYEVLSQAIEVAVNKLFPIVGDSIFGFNDDKPEELIGKYLLENHQLLATAESCTGGAIASAITSVPGCSAYFNGSVVAYSNEVKTTVLGVNNDDLLQHGAVSQQVVEQMALGVRNALRAQWAVATSGIAGPTGGSEEKPVGTVWIAIAKPDGSIISAKHMFGPVRERNIIRSKDTALIWLLQEIKAFK